MVKTTRLGGSWVTFLFLPHYDVYRVSITEQTTAKCYLFVNYTTGREYIHSRVLASRNRSILVNCESRLSIIHLQRLASFSIKSLRMLCQANYKKI